jgi:xylulokinase
VALLPGYGLGAYASLEEAVARIVRVQNSYNPDEELRKEYQKRLMIYEKLYPLVKELRKERDASQRPKECLR